MREDMFKVIVERPRLGRKSATRSKLRLDKAPDRKHATGRRMVLEQAGYTKCLNENLAPLRRYLHQQVGRPWDKVFSEICASLDTGSTVKQHVRDHLSDFILLKVTRDRSGGLVAAGHWGQPLPPDRWWARLYVDPQDGLIKSTERLCRKLRVEPLRAQLRARRAAYINAEATEDLKWLDPVRALVRLDGGWFDVSFNREPRSVHGVQERDIDLLAQVRSGVWREHLRWRVVSQKQLNRRALKHRGLRNH